MKRWPGVTMLLMGAFFFLVGIVPTMPTEDTVEGYRPSVDCYNPESHQEVFFGLDGFCEASRSPGAILFGLLLMVAGGSMWGWAEMQRRGLA